jgi:inosine-uridine nucleoside N-ribohydrolase
MANKLRVWIDTDPAVTAGNGEVDDAFALVQALRSPELDVVGISAIYGNAPLDHSYAMTKEIVARCGRTDVPVYAGCESAADTGKNEAVEAIQTALTRNNLLILALGPATTVSLVYDYDRGQAENLTGIIFVGGRRPGLQFKATPNQVKPFPDMNFEMDPDAVAFARDMGAPLGFCGWEAASKAWLYPEDLDQLAQGDEVCRWLADSARPWMARWQNDFKAPGFTPFDCLAVSLAIAPEMFDTEIGNYKFHKVGDTPQLLWGPKLSGVPALYSRSVDVARFKADLMQRLLGQASAA